MSFFREIWGLCLVSLPWIQIAESAHLFFLLTFYFLPTKSVLQLPVSTFAGGSGLKTYLSSGKVRELCKAIRKNKHTKHYDFKCMEKVLLKLQGTESVSARIVPTYWPIPLNCTQVACASQADIEIPLFNKPLSCKSFGAIKWIF